MSIAGFDGVGGAAVRQTGSGVGRRARRDGESERAEEAREGWIVAPGRGCSVRPLGGGGLFSRSGRSRSRAWGPHRRTVRRCMDPARLRGRSGRRVVPGAQVTQNLFHHPPVMNHGDNPHRILANGAAQRINVPHAEDEVAPAFRGEIHWGRRGNARPADRQLRRQAAMAHAAHFVAVPAIVAGIFRVHLLELVVMAAGALPEGRLSRISGAIDLHSQAGSFRPGPGVRLSGRWRGRL